MLITRELLAKIKKIQIRTEKFATEILSGEYRSAFRGKGLNFDKIREYQFGDDIRNIDWKVTARMNEPFIRQYKEERQLSIVIILDMSASNNFGTQMQTKQEMSTELASVLATLAIKNNDKVGMMIVTDVIESYIVPKQGKAHVFRIIKDLITYKPKSKKTNLKKVLEEAISLIPRNSVVFLISDFIPSEGAHSKASFAIEPERGHIAKGDISSNTEKDLNESFDYERELKLLRKTQDLIAISIRDPREFELPEIGLIEVVNPETGHKDLLNLNRKSVRLRFAEMQNKHVNFLVDKFRRLGIDFLNLQTGKPYIQTLLTLFLTRERRN